MIVLRRISALTLVLSLPFIGAPLPVHAASEELPPERVLTWHGQPLSEALGNPGNAFTRTESSNGAHSPVVLFGDQGQAGQEPDDGEGMSGRKKFWIAAAVGGASGALLGWATGAENCRNETTSVDPDQNCVISTSSAAFGAIFGLLGFGIGAGVGALIAK